jgi:hypothetical protein
MFETVINSFTSESITLMSSLFEGGHLYTLKEAKAPHLTLGEPRVLLFPSLRKNSWLHMMIFSFFYV